MIKKLITSICICIAVLMMQQLALAAEDYDAYYAETLQGLGIEVNAGAEDSITKGAFCGMAAALMQQNTDYDGQALYFRDVPVTHPYYREIATLAAQGIAIGDDKGRFYPDEPLTTETASAILLRCLGYELRVQHQGGWSAGYHSVAVDLGITDGVGAAADTGLTGAQVMRMLYNTLLAPTFEMNLSDKTLEEGVPLGEKLYDAVELEGIVEQTRFTGLHTLEGCPEGMAVIDGTSVYTGETNADGYLGYRIRAMAVEADDAYTLVSIVKHNRTAELRLDYRMIDDVPDLYSIAYETEDSGRVQKAKLDRNASVIYNYQKLMAYEAEDLLLDNGYMELVDNDNDGTYDVVLIYEYKTYFVAGIDTASGQIYDKYGYEMLEPDEDTIIMNAHNYEVDISAIKTDSVLSVFQPRRAGAGSYTVIAVSDLAPVEGTVTGFASDRDILVTINGEDYVIDKRYLEVSAENDQVTEIKLGVSGIFYLNKDGMISGFKYLSGNEIYGFMRKMYLEETEDKAYFELFSQEAVFVSGEVADKVKINGVRSTGPAALLEDGILFPEGKFRPQLVKFRLDNEGRLTSLKVASEAVASSPMLTDEEVLAYNGTVTDGEMRPGGRRYAYKYLYADDTVVFNVPAEHELANKEKYSISDKLYTDGAKATWKLYDVGIDYIIGAAVQEAGKNVVNLERQQELTIITNINEVYDEETQEVRMAVTGVTAGAVRTYTCAPDDGFFDGMQVGDFARILTDAATGETLGAQLIFTFRDAGPTADTDAIIYHDKYARKMPHSRDPIPSGDYDYGLTQVYGRCVAKGTNTIALTLDGGTTVYPCYIEKNAGYYLVEYKGEKVHVTKVTADAIVPASSPTAANGHEVMICVRNASTREVFIIKED